MTVSVAIYGAAGRMGQTLLKLADQSPLLQLAGAYEKTGHSAIGKEQFGIAISELPDALDADVIVDFSLPEGTANLLDRLMAHPKPLVCGTTGLGSAEREAMTKLAEKVPVVWAPNFSTGVNLLFDLVGRATAILAPDVEVEIVETHHVHKKDAPSGTAAKLLEIAADKLDLDPLKHVQHGREGIVGERPKAQIGMHALRGGEVFGEHTVYLFANGERLELTHRLESRDALASGALRAAGWVVDQPAGFYSMKDVLGMKG